MVYQLFLGDSFDDPVVTLILPLIVDWMLVKPIGPHVLILFACA